MRIKDQGVDNLIGFNSGLTLQGFHLLALAGVVFGLMVSLRADDRPPSLPSETANNIRDQALPRRAVFGVQLAPVSLEMRERQDLRGDGGAVIEKIFAGTSAAESGFHSGDVILAIGGAEVTGIPMLLDRLAKARAGDVLTIGFVRDRVRQERQVVLREMPRERSETYDVLYSHVTSHGARLRTIITRPQDAGRKPAVFLLQGGHTCFSVESPLAEPSGFIRVARGLAEHGYVTLRIERPGCGDSEGGPLRDVDFNTELDGYKEALRALSKLDYVDPGNIFLFGHSMGGIMAPLIATELPVRGIAVYGTTAETWFESVIGQRRRLASLDGTSPAEVNCELLDQTRFWYPLAVEMKTPEAIRDQNPDLPWRVWESWITDNEYVADRHYTFYHQIANQNLTEAWSMLAAKQLPDWGGTISTEEPEERRHPQVLAIWGKSDWLSTRDQNSWIADVVNRSKAGNGSFVALDSIDHFFLRAATPAESYRIWKGSPPGKFNTIIIETICAWLDEVSGLKKEKSA